jgi:hypothetical protein
MVIEITFLGEPHGVKMVILRYGIMETVKEFVQFRCMDHMLKEHHLLIKSRIIIINPKNKKAGLIVLTKSWFGHVQMIHYICGNIAILGAHS